MFKGMRLVAASLALGMVTGTASAQDLVDPGKLTYGTAATFAPFEYTVAGQLTGSDIELVVVSHAE